jgi:hypothetical protein
MSTELDPLYYVPSSAIAKRTVIPFLLYFLPRGVALASFAPFLFLSLSFLDAILMTPTSLSTLPFYEKDTHTIKKSHVINRSPGDDFDRPRSAFFPTSNCPNNRPRPSLTSQPCPSPFDDPSPPPLLLCELPAPSLAGASRSPESPARTLSRNRRSSPPSFAHFLP